MLSLHSLGGALASMLAFELAGRDEDWIPKPVNCVTYASPFNGSSGFRDAFEVCYVMRMTFQSFVMLFVFKRMHRDSRSYNFKFSHRASTLTFNFSYIAT